MDADIPDLCARVRRGSAAVLGGIAPIAGAVRDAEGGVTGLPPVVRGLIASVVAREVARNTGQGIPAWVVMLDGLAEALRALGSLVERIEGAGAAREGDRAALREAAGRVDAALPRVERLDLFLQRAPAMVRRAPAAIVPSKLSEPFLRTLNEQGRAIRRALAAMPALSRDLRALADQTG